MAGEDVLQALYPFLHGKASKAPVENDALLASVRGKARHHREVVEAFFEKNEQAVIDAAEAIASSYRKSGRLFTMGNGGSSCDAAHVAVEFLHPVTTGRPALTAIDLTADKSMLTAVANDVGFEHVFVRQLCALARRGDCLIGLSTSGNSPNLVRAFLKARDLGLTTIGLSGKSGGEMARIGLDHVLVVETDSIHRIQECHLIVYHMLWDLVHTFLANDRGDLESLAPPVGGSEP